MSIPVLTLHQPWACLVEVGAKPFETRHFPIPDRLLGKRVMIHAAARPCATDFDQETVDAITEAFGQCGWNYSLPRGVIVASAVLAESLPAESVEADPFGNYAIGRFAWVLKDVRPVLPHLPAKGRQQIGWAWEPPPGFVA